MSLATQVRKGVKWTTSSTLIIAVSQLLLLALAARFYLTPTEVGLFAIIQITLGFCQLFMDMGIGNALIQKQNVKARHLSELFLVNLIIAAVLAVLIYLSAKNIAYFFEAPNVTPYIQLIAPSFLLAALYRIHLVSLQKELAFSLIAKVELVAQISGFSVALLSLFYNLGVVALVYGYLTNLAVQGALFWCFSPFRLMFVFPKVMSELKPYFSFGAYQTVDGTVNYFSSQFDVILVGKMFGTEVLGGYSLARQYCFRPAMVINPILTRIAFPLMSKLQNSDKLPSIYCKLSNVLASINFPLYLTLFVFSEEFILVLFGTQWLHIVPIFRLMALWCLIRSTMNPVGSLMMAKGKVKRLLIWNLMLLFLIPTSVYIGGLFSVEGVVIALVALQFILLILHSYILLDIQAEIKPLLFFYSIASPLLISVIAMILSFLLCFMIANIYFKLIVFTVAYTLLYGSFSYFYNPVIKKIRTQGFSLN
jgi:O-antigen/teichoic acid export membrane protein